MSGKQLTEIARVPILAITLCMMAYGIGCKSPDVAAYKAERGTRVTAEAALSAWNDYVKQFKPPVSDELKVQAAFDKYKAAQVLLLDAAIAYKGATTATNSAGQSQVRAMLDSATLNAATALTDLVTLLRTLNVKI